MAGLEEFKKHDGAKNLENPSQRSRLTAASLASSMRRRLAGMEPKTIGNVSPLTDKLPIKEMDLDDLRKPLNLLDRKTGKTIQLTAEHLILLEQLSRQNDIS